MLSHLGRYASVGLFASGLYAVLAWLLTERLIMAAPLASLLAYAIASVFSYLGQRILTFRSTRPHRLAVPAFVMLAGLGYALAFVIPLLVTTIMGMAPIVGIALTCLVVPPLSYLLMSRVIFRMEPERAG